MDQWFMAEVCDASQELFETGHSTIVKASKLDMMERVPRVEKIGGFERFATEEHNDGPSQEDFLGHPCPIPVIIVVQAGTKVIMSLPDEVQRCRPLVSLVLNVLQVLHPRRHHSAFPQPQVNKESSRVDATHLRNLVVSLRDISLINADGINPVECHWHPSDHLQEFEEVSPNIEWRAIDVDSHLIFDRPPSV
jgi:hypothetical protein